MIFCRGTGGKGDQSDRIDYSGRQEGKHSFHFNRTHNLILQHSYPILPGLDQTEIHLQLGPADKEEPTEEEQETSK